MHPFTVRDVTGSTLSAGRRRVRHDPQGAPAAGADVTIVAPELCPKLAEVVVALAGTLPHHQQDAGAGQSAGHRLID